MGKKHRNRVNSPKKNNHIPAEAIIAEQEAHGKEYSAKGRKNGPGHNQEVR
ncbi:hypothetical protein [Peribacillus alkalitolerans]|jgi:hypothetical protein|uniref:hypothetical protein n=1 Tax=Peribacillus alkalitolerans TaxID=1550385 RepID=UPI00196857AB|nr:hypothetical protein [Peribacillus alkalitolerans]